MDFKKVQLLHLFYLLWRHDMKTDYTEFTVKGSEIDKINHKKKILLTSKESDFNKCTNIKEANNQDYFRSKDANTIITQPQTIINQSRKKKGGLKTDNKPLSEFEFYLSSPRTAIEVLNKEFKNGNASIEVYTSVAFLKKHFTITDEEKEVFNACLSLIKQKRDILQANNHIFISFYELHRQLGYRSKLRANNIQNYKTIIKRLDLININMIFKEKYGSYKKVSNLENVPIIELGGFYKTTVKGYKTKIKQEVFCTSCTMFMSMHFDMTERYKVLELEEPIKRSKIQHSETLYTYFEKIIFLEKQKKNNEKEIYIETVLKELGLLEAYKKTREKAKFINRKIVEPLKKLPSIQYTTFNKKEQRLKINF